MVVGKFSVLSQGFFAVAGSRKKSKTSIYLLLHLIKQPYGHLTAGCLFGFWALG
jgi:hypothetical protein